jgi:putative ABC transport system permease protein
MTGWIIAVRYLWERKLRTILTTLSVMFGVMIVFSLNAIIPALSDSFKRGMMATAYQVDLIITSESRGAFDEMVLKRVSSFKTVVDYTGIVESSLLIPPDMAPKLSDGSKINGYSVTGVEFTSYSKLRKIDLVEGRFPVSEHPEMLITKDLAGKSGQKVGDTVILPSGKGTMKFVIVGIYKSLPSFGGMEPIIVNLKDAQKLFSLEGRIYSILGNFSPEVDKKLETSRILKDLGDGYKLGENEAGTEFDSALSMGQKMMAIIGLFALVIGGFILFITFRTIVVERRKDIGVLRSIGMTSKQVVGLIIFESLIQGVLGTIFGILLGIGSIYLIVILMNPMWEKILHMPMEVPTISVWLVGLSVILGLGMALLGSLIPAISAGKVTPLEAMRPSSAMEIRNYRVRRNAGIILIVIALICLVVQSTIFISAGLVLFLAGLLVMGPFIVKPMGRFLGSLVEKLLFKEGSIAKNQLEFHPRRASITSFIVLSGIAVMVAAGGMIYSFNDGMIRYLNKNFGSDFVLMPQSMILNGGNVGADNHLADSIRKIQGVEAVTGLRIAKTNAAHTDFQVVGIDPETYPNIAGLIFSKGKPEEIYNKLKLGKSIVINNILALSAKLDIGDKVSMNTPEGIKTYTIVGIGMDMLTAKLATGYISHKDMTEDFHVNSDVIIMINRNKSDSQTDPKVIEKEIKEKVKDYPSFSVLSFTDFRDSIMETMDSAMSMMVFLFLALMIPSFIALINTMSISVMERVREIGILRAVGATRGQVIKIIISESLILSLIGAFGGILTGTWLLGIIIQGIGVMGFQFEYTLPVNGYGMAVVSALLLGFISSVLPARYAARLSTIKAISYE